MLDFIQCEEGEFIIIKNSDQVSAILNSDELKYIKSFLNSLSQHGLIDLHERFSRQSVNGTR